MIQVSGVDIQTYDRCWFIAPTVYFDAYNRSRIHIGSNVFITHDVILLVHDQSATTAYNSQNDVSGYDVGAYRNPADIHIGNNVFIGMRSILLPGTTIEDDVVVAAGSVVKGYLPRGGVYAGVPARRIRDIGDYFRKLESNGCYENPYAI